MTYGNAPLEIHSPFFFRVFFFSDGPQRTYAPAISAAAADPINVKCLLSKENIFVYVILITYAIASGYLLTRYAFLRHTTSIVSNALWDMPEEFICEGVFVCWEAVILHCKQMQTK